MLGVFSSVDDIRALDENEVAAETAPVADESTPISGESVAISDKTTPIAGESAAVSEESAVVSEESPYIDPFRRDLCIPPQFRYQCFTEMRALKTLLGGPDTDNVLVVCREYELLYRELEEGRYKTDDNILVLGHPGTGSYRSWLQSQINADFYP